jgi:hypothetical protein
MSSGILILSCQVNAINDNSVELYKRAKSTLTRVGCAVLAAAASRPENDRAWLERQRRQG